MISIKKITSIFSRTKGVNALLREIDKNVDLLISGVLKCNSCKKIYNIETLEPLEMMTCDGCDGFIFVPLKIGNFWLFQPLGGGGMGAVYKAYHQKYRDNYYAVKILPRNGKDNPLFIEAIVNEMNAANTFPEHPHLAGVVSSGFKDNEYYYAMEFLCGERLDNLIDNLGRIPQKDCLRYMLQILSAEQCMYDTGFLFRDIKPENIIINPKGDAVLYDYGLCMTLQQALEDPGDMIEGSPFYMPPERIFGTGEGQFSEIYSIAQVMYHSLTGKPFFSADEINAIAQKHVSNLRMGINTKDLTYIDPSILNIMNRMFKKEPSKRPQTFSEVERELYSIYEALP